MCFSLQGFGQGTSCRVCSEHWNISRPHARTSANAIARGEVPYGVPAAPQCVPNDNVGTVYLHIYIVPSTIHLRAHDLYAACADALHARIVNPHLAPPSVAQHPHRNGSHQSAVPALAQTADSSPTHGMRHAKCDDN